MARGQASRGTFLVPGDKGGPALAMVYCGFGFWLFAAFGTASLFGSIYTGALRYLALARVVTRFGVFGTKLAPFLQQSVCNKCVYIRVCKGVFQQLRHFWFSVLCAFGTRFCTKCVYIRVCNSVFQQLRHFWFSVLCVLVHFWYTFGTKCAQNRQTATGALRSCFSLAGKKTS